MICPKCKQEVKYTDVNRTKIQCTNQQCGFAMNAALYTTFHRAFHDAAPAKETE